MKTTTLFLVIALLSTTSCRRTEQVRPIVRTDAPSLPGSLNLIPWPDDNSPSGFMTGLQLVSLPAERSKMIIGRTRPSKTPQAEPDFITPLEAAQYFGTHLNMGEPPKYMAIHGEPSGAKSYLFSGGLHWAKEPLFSEGAVLLETGEIRLYRGLANE